MLRLGEISRVIGPCRDGAGLAQRLASMTADERRRLSDAIEAQRSHFPSEGEQPAGSPGAGPEHPSDSQPPPPAMQTPPRA
jgi:hypothetical protein